MEESSNNKIHYGGFTCAHGTSVRKMQPDVMLVAVLKYHEHVSLHHKWGHLGLYPLKVLLLPFSA